MSLGQRTAKLPRLCAVPRKTLPKPESFAVTPAGSNLLEGHNEKLNRCTGVVRVFRDEERCPRRRPARGMTRWPSRPRYAALQNPIRTFTATRRFKPSNLTASDFVRLPILLNVDERRRFGLRLPTPSIDLYLQFTPSPTRGFAVTSPGSYRQFRTQPTPLELRVAALQIRDRQPVCQSQSDTPSALTSGEPAKGHDLPPSAPFKHYERQRATKNTAPPSTINAPAATKGRGLEVPPPIESVFRALASGGHFDDPRIKSPHGFHQVRLCDHHLVDVLVNHRHLIKSCAE